ncbi:MAG: FKBP-type peptidyl-prolyl cis-trans isomerase [Nitrospirae bacterium]|nr:MAG: FKBP-type peptidyl-prolyl cis-trans isomerase [Nitrospirota bacterium]
MKLRFVTVLCAVFLAGIVAASEKLELKTQKDKVSYSIGLDIGNNMKKQSIDINPEAFAKGLNDALSGGTPLMTEKEIRDIMMTFQQEMVAKQLERSKGLGEKNKKEGEAFLAGNKKKERVATLPSGLQYKVIKEGSGKTPKATDTVTVNYRGTLIDGTEFDSSYKRGEAANFQVGSVIVGWTEALQLMKEGAKWELFIPAALAYGERGAGNAIGPNAVLIFEVELISIMEK